MKITNSVLISGIAGVALSVLSGCGANLSVNNTSTPGSALNNAASKPSVSTVTNVSIHASPLRSTPPAFISMHMANSNTGWAVGRDGSIWRTTDGAVRWNRVGPPPEIQPSSQMKLYLYSLEQKHAWLVVAGPDGSSVTVFRTSNGGSTWNKVIVHHVGEVVSMQFINDNNGSFTLSQGAAAGSEGETIYKTNDGGTSWTKVSVSDLHSKGGVPFAGDKTGASFLDDKHGWATGYPVNGHNFLYQTHDGGHTWNPQTLTIPSKINETYFVTYPPVFFNKQNGVLPTSVDRDPGTFLVFRTTDGGIMWKPTTPVTRTVQDVLLQTWSFASEKNWFVANGDQLLVTHDAGQTWKSVKSNVPLENVSELEFTSSTDGWALMSSGVLYHSTDGGRTWHRLSPAHN